MQLVYMTEGKQVEGEIVGASGCHLKVNRSVGGRMVEELVAAMQVRPEHKDAFYSAWRAFQPADRQWQTEDGPVDLQNLI